MSNQLEEITVQLLGKNFCIRADAEKHEALNNVVKYLNEQMQIIKGNSSVIGFERIITLTAINIADELLNGGDGSKQKLINATDRLNKINTKLESALKSQPVSEGL